VSPMPEYDAVVVGAGPNGLSAAIEVARNGGKVLVVEANETPGGGVRSAEVTLPGFVHDICSTQYPLVAGSPFLSTLPLDEFGLEWENPDLPLAHPMDDGSAAEMHTSVERTANLLGPDSESYRAVFAPYVDRADELAPDLLAPLQFPRHPFLMARFGLNALQPASFLARRRFETENARALFSGIAAHAFMKLDRPITAAIALMLGVYGHRHNWPFVRGGSGKLTEAMVGYLQSIGGEIQTGWRVNSVSELPEARATLLNVTPKQVLQLAGDRLPGRYRRSLEKFRYNPGVFKMDWAVSEPVPWTSDVARRAGTVHLGGTMQEIVISEDLVNRGIHPEKPFVLLAQPSLFDASRAPEGKHTVWAYCHVPNGSTVDMSERIEQQIERFAPGFRETVLARHVRFTADLEAENANCIGGEINGGVQDIVQHFMRPVARWNPYRTPVPGLYICSASTPPGGGVHGMSGYHAARAALADMDLTDVPPR
jgi:phytoene dehydrogenase-like protein